MLSDNAKELIEFAHNLFDLSYDEIIKILEEAITYIEELIEFAHNLFDLSYDEIIKILEEAITYIEELKGEY